MKGEQAVEIFKLAKRENLLPGKLEELVPLSFIGQAAVSFYRQKIKLMDQLKMTENQRKVTLRDGQDAGEMLLDIEARIGELASKEKKAETLSIHKVSGGLAGRKSMGKPLKHERLGLTPQKIRDSQTIAKHPEVVEKVKAEAKKNEDIPTKTAVLSEIKYQKEKKRREEAESKRQDMKAVIAVDQVQYINALDRCISILPLKPPIKWNDDAFREAKSKAKIIIKRLEVFNG